MCIAVAHSEVVLNPLPDADDEDRARPTGDTRRKLTDVLQRDSVRRPLTAMLNSRVAIQIRLVNKYDIILLHISIAVKSSRIFYYLLFVTNGSSSTKFIKD